MKISKRLALVLVMIGGLIGGALLPAGDAEALKKRCGSSHDGTFNYNDYSCTGAAADCTEITVCG